MFLSLHLKGIKTHHIITSENEITKWSPSPPTTANAVSMVSMLDLTTWTKTTVMSARCTPILRTDMGSSLACSMTCSFLWLSWFVLIHSGNLCHIPAPRFLPACEYLWNNQGFLAFCDSYIIQRRATYIFCYKILLMKIYLFFLWKNHRIFVFNMSFVRTQHKQWESKNGFVLNKKWNDKRHYK